MTDKKDTKKILKKHFAAILILPLVLLIFWKCPFVYFIGIPCMGCGLTRATLSALTFDFASAFYFHPLWWLATPAALYFVHRKLFKTDARIEKIILILICILFIAVYVVRLFGDSQVLYFDFSNSVVGRLFN